MLPARNDPCPCGSGKKFKKCCGAAPTSGGDVLVEARSALGRGDHRRVLSLAVSALKTNSNNIEAIRLCGVASLALGEWEQARRNLERAIKLVPNDATFRSNLAFALLNLHRLEDAERQCRVALELDSSLADAHNNLAQVLVALGRQDEAVTAYRHAVASNPASAVFRFNLGALLHRLAGQMQEAESCYRQALALSPTFAPALANLGVVLLGRKQVQEALEYLNRALALDAKNIEVLNNLGLARLYSKEYSAAAACFRRVLELADYLPAYANLGVALEHCGDLPSAIGAYQKALDRDPKNALGFKNLAKAIAISGDAELAHRFIARAEPDLKWLSPDFYPWYTNACQQAGDMVRIEKAWELLRTALESDSLAAPDLQASLLLLNYDDAMPEEDVFRFHRAWGQQAAASLPRTTPRLGSPRSVSSGTRRIRLGYLSPDFRRHSVGYFFRNIIRQHDKQRFEVHCYANMRDGAGDDFTKDIQQHTDRFEYVRELEDRELAERIRADGIDILIDLAGHTRDARTAVLSARPAGIQIVYLGYPNTTGADFVDHWITDVHAHAENDPFHTENLLRLPESFLCFGGTEERLLDATPPAVRNGYLTFGSFNNLAKLSPATIRLWSLTLKGVPSSRLLIKANGASSQAFRANVMTQFRKYDIDEERIMFLGRVAGLAEHLDCYHQVDIALDSIPYNGTTTTCEALWMGVPVMTLVGARHRQRTSYSILRNIGTDETIASSDSEFIATAARLAGDTGALSGLRARVATAIRGSILCNPERFTRQFESALLSTLDG